MIDLRTVLPERLKEVFQGETQETSARKLSTVQGTISKWLNGEVIPPTEMLLLIAEAYKVSVDWLLGLSEQKRVDGIAYEEITYAQAIRVIDHLLTTGSIDHPDMNSFEVEKEDGEDPEEEPEEKEPRYDPDYLKVNDRALSYLLRRRMKVVELDDDYYVLWKGKLGIFEGIKLLKYDWRMQEAIDTKPWFKFEKDADWTEMLKEFEAMDGPELDEYIKKHREEGKKNG